MAATPDEIAQAFIDTLSPGGIPVGAIGAFTKRTPDPTPYQGPLPIVLVRAVQNLHGRVTAAGGLTLGKVDMGFVEVVYHDASLSQQKALDPTVTLSQIEDRAVAARNAIVATLDNNNILSGEVTISSEHIEELYWAQGMFVIWEGAEWVGFNLKIDYVGELPT